MLPPPSLTAGATTPSTVAHDGSHDAVHRQTLNTGEIWNITAEATKPALPPFIVGDATRDRGGDAHGGEI
ncbi:hypothetical protein U1Q18_004451 [Sarracenia purpurea var. burkii]